MRRSVQRLLSLLAVAGVSSAATAQTHQTTPPKHSGNVNPQAAAAYDPGPIIGVGIHTIPP
jgi:hypothetical protein